MLRIGICDDAAQLRFTLQAQLTRILQAHGTECEFFAFSSGEGLLQWLEKHAGELDLVFLDIELSGMDGMDTARQLQQQPNAPLLAFVTSYADYVFDGYAYGALGYVIKPPKDSQLEEICLRASALLCQQAPQYYICRNRDGFYRIAKDSILYFYSDRRLVTCVTTAREYTFYARLDAVAQELGEGFIRIHQRYLVRANAVERVEGNMVYLSQVSLPVSRAHQAAALTALARAMLQ